MDKDGVSIHPMSIVEENVHLGKGTRIWAFTHILSGAIIGRDCNICDHVFIEGNVILGDRVTVKCGIYMWDGLIVEDDVFLGPNVVFTNDKRPRSKKYSSTYPKTLLMKGSSIGANATILPGVLIGRFAMVGAGTVVTHEVPNYGVVVGNPGRLIGWVCSCGEKIFPTAEISRCQCGKYYETCGAGIVEKFL